MHGPYVSKRWIQIQALPLDCGTLGSCLPSSELSLLSTKEAVQELDAVCKVVNISENSNNGDDDDDDDNPQLLLLLKCHTVCSSPTLALISSKAIAVGASQ